jgi:hypothetical protein
VNELANVYVFTDPAQTQEGRILGAEVFLVEIVQRFQVLSKIGVRFEADEYRLVDQKLQHDTWTSQRFGEAGTWNCECTTGPYSCQGSVEDGALRCRSTDCLSCKLIVKKDGLNTAVFIY